MLASPTGGVLSRDFSKPPSRTSLTHVLRSATGGDSEAVSLACATSRGRHRGRATTFDPCVGVLALERWRSRRDGGASTSAPASSGASASAVPIEAGRNHQGLAEVAERRGDLEAAREHLDAAGALFAKHGAKLYLDQVIAKKRCWGRGGAHRAPAAAGGAPPRRGRGGGCDARLDSRRRASPRRPRPRR